MARSRSAMSSRGATSWSSTPTCSTRGSRGSGSARAAPGTPGTCGTSPTRSTSTPTGSPSPSSPTGPTRRSRHSASSWATPRRGTPSPTSITPPWASPAGSPASCGADDKIYLTYWITGRGDEVMGPSFGLLDMTVYGRREEWEDSPVGWPQNPTHSVLRSDEHGRLDGAQKRRAARAAVDPPRRDPGVDQRSVAVRCSAN